MYGRGCFIGTLLAIVLAVAYRTRSLEELENARIWRDTAMALHVQSNALLSLQPQNSNQHACLSPKLATSQGTYLQSARYLSLFPAFIHPSQRACGVPRLVAQSVNKVRLLIADRPHVGVTSPALSVLRNGEKSTKYHKQVLSFPRLGYQHVYDNDRGGCCI